MAHHVRQWFSAQTLAHLARVQRYYCPYVCWFLVGLLTVIRPIQAQTADSKSAPVVRYSSTGNVSIPFEFSPANDPNLKAVLFTQDPATNGWSVARSVPAIRQSFDLTDLPDGTYNLAVRAVYGNDAQAVARLPVPESPELVVVVDTKPPVLVLTLMQMNWQAPHLECLISDANPVPESLQVFAKAFKSEQYHRIKARTVSFRNEGNVWRCLLEVETTEHTEFVRVDLNDQSGNNGSEELRVREPKEKQTSQSRPSDEASRLSRPQNEAPVRGLWQQQQKAQNAQKSRNRIVRPGSNELSWKDIGDQNSPWKSLETPPTNDRRRIVLASADEDSPQEESSISDVIDDDTFKPQLTLPPATQSRFWSQTPRQDASPAPQPIMMQPDQTPTIRMLPPEQNTGSRPSRQASPVLPVPPVPLLAAPEPLQQTNPDVTLDGVSEYDIMLRAARNSVSLGETQEALVRFRACLRLAPDRPEARREYAHLLSSTQPEAAIPVLEAVLTANPSDITTAVILAELLIDARRHDRATTVLKNATAVTPGQIELDSLMVRLMVAKGELRDASEYFDSHIASSIPTDPRVRTQMMRSLSDLGRDEEALTLAEAAFLERPGDLQTATDLIRIRSRLGQTEGLDETIQSLDLSTAADHLSAVSLAKELVASGFYQPAHRLLDAIQKQDANHPDVLLMLTELLLLEGFAEAAESTLQQIQIPDDDPRRLTLKAKLHVLRGELAQARVVLSAIPRSKDDLELILLDGRLLETATAYDLAEQCYQTGLSRHRDHVKLQNALARLYLRTGHYSQAMALCESVFRQDPRNHDAWLTWCECCLMSNQSIEAVARVSEALSRSLDGGEDARFLHCLSGYLSLRNGNHSAAFGEFGFGKIDRRIPPESPEFAFAWYQCLIRSGQPSQAEAFLSTCLTTPAYGVRLAAIAEDQLQFPAAKLIILQLAEQFPDNHVVMQQFADLMVKTGNGSAVQNYEILLTRSPQNVVARMGLAHLMWSLQDFERAVGLLDAVLQEVPEHRVAAKDRARILNQWKGKDTGLRGYRDAEQALKHPITGNIHASLLDDQAFVRSPIEFQSLSTETLFSNRLEEQATFLSDWRPDNAAAALRRLQDLTPQDSHVAFLLAQQNIRMGRFAEAEAALEELLDNDPWHTQAGQALAYTRRKLEHRVTTHFSFFGQQGRNGLSQINRTRFGAKYFKPVGSANDVFSIGYSHIMLYPVNAPHTLGNSLDLGYHWLPDPNLQIDAQMSVEAYNAGFDTKPVFNVATRYRVLDGFYLGIRAQLENVAENSESVRQGIYQYGIGPALEWDISPRWNLQAQYNIRNYSDDNLVQLFDIRNVYIFRNAPQELRGIINYHFEDFSSQTIRNPVLNDLTGTIHPYFAPELFGYVNAGLEWQHWLNPMILGEYEFSYTVRYALQWDNLNVAYNTFGVSLNWDITENSRLAVSTDHVLSGPYDSASVMAFLTIQLPSGRAFLREGRGRRSPDLGSGNH